MKIMLTSKKEFDSIFLALNPATTIRPELGDNLSRYAPEIDTLFVMDTELREDSAEDVIEEYRKTQMASQ